MSDQDIDRIMDSWADHETASAPDMNPTDAMYHLVEAKRGRKPLTLFTSHRAFAVTALAGLVALTIVVVALLNPSPRPDAPSGQAVAMVGLRDGFPVEKGVVPRGPTATPNQGRGKGANAINQLWFQFQVRGAPFVESVDPRVPASEVLVLSSNDNYRIVMELNESQHVHIFQLTSANSLARLFPDDAHTPDQNPLRGQHTYEIPSAGRWFHLNGSEGDGSGESEQRLYIVVSDRPIQGLENLYAQYIQAEDETSKQQSLASLLEALEALTHTTGGQTDAWVFVFRHR